MWNFALTLYASLSAKIIKHDHVVLNAQRVEQVKHCLGHHRRTSSEVACKKKLAREFGLPHFLLLNQTHEVWFSVYAIPLLFFGVPLRIYPPKFGRRLCETILRICSQIPPKFDLLTFAHTAFAHFTTYLSVVHYNKPLGLFMCKHLSDRVAYL